MAAVQERSLYTSACTLAAWLFLSQLPEAYSLVFKDVSSELFPHNTSKMGKIVAFSNLNDDRNTDILCVNGSLQWVPSEGRFASAIHHTWGVYDSVQLVDLDDNGKLDAMATLKNGSSTHELHLYYNLDFRDVKKSIKSQTRPLILDSNGDHQIDILTKNRNGNWEIWTWNITAANVTSSSLTLGLGELSPAHYLYGDMDGDCLGDIVAMDTLNHKMEVLSWKGAGGYSEPGSVQLDIGAGTIVQEALVDLDVNGLLDLLLVVKRTTVYQLMMSLQPHHGTSPVVCTPGNDRPRFSSTVNVTNCDLSSNLPFVSIGDVNLDGFPDVLLTCNGRVLLFVNSGCGQGCAHPVSLQQAEIKELDDLRNVTRAVFFDLKDDGTLDILVEQEGGHITALEYVPQDINMFLKVYVPSGSGASSAVLPGSTVIYVTHDRNGQQQVSVGQFWSSSATSFLPLPYVVLGLGLAPNFVEDFVMGVLSEGAANMNRKWTRLIPNSQLKVITNPVPDPSRWKLALYLTPSSLVWITCGVMTGVCILVSILVLLLQIREKYIDTKERKQANLQFHFDSL